MKKKTLSLLLYFIDPCQRWAEFLLIPSLSFRKPLPPFKNRNLMKDVRCNSFWRKRQISKETSGDGEAKKKKAREKTMGKMEKEDFKLLWNHFLHISLIISSYIWPNVSSFVFAFSEHRGEGEGKKQKNRDEEK